MWPNLVVNTRRREFILYDHHYDPKHPHHLKITINSPFLKTFLRTLSTYQGIVADLLPFFKKDFPPAQPVTQSKGEGKGMMGQ